MPYSRRAVAPENHAIALQVRRKPLIGSLTVISDQVGDWTGGGQFVLGPAIEVNEIKIPAFRACLPL